LDVILVSLNSNYVHATESVEDRLNSGIFVQPTQYLFSSLTLVIIFSDVGSSIKTQRQCIVYSPIRCGTPNSGPDFLRENAMKVAIVKSVN